MSKKTRTAKVKPSVEPKVEIDSEVTRCIRQHARSHSKTEVCGVLIGEKTERTIEIRSSIEALHAAQAGTHVTFTQEAWEEIYRIKDERYPYDRIVGWYHSHPGFGVFLSEHDLFIQKNFFSAPDQVAWVYDPQTDEEGCFGWVSGEVHRLSSLSIADRNGDGVERTPKRIDSNFNTDADFDDESFDDSRPGRKSEPPAYLRWSVLALGYISMLMLGFAIAFLFFPPPIPVPVTISIDPATGKAAASPSVASPAPGQAASPASQSSPRRKP